MKHFIYILTLLFPVILISQKNWKVTLLTNDSGIYKEIKTVTLKDSISISAYLRKTIVQQKKTNHPLASFDTLLWNNEEKTLEAILFKGPTFSNMQIYVSDKDRSLIRKIPGINERVLTNTKLQAAEIADTYERVLSYLENNGYPFCKVGFRNINLTPESPSAILSIETGPLVKWNKVNIKGEAKIKEGFLLTYLGIRPEENYSERRFKQIQEKINQLQFLDLEQPAQVAFSPDGAELFLYLKTSQISSANGILGIQPGTDGKVVFTGDVQLKLINLLKRGEQLDLSWKSLQPQTQQLDVGINYPFLFKSNFGVEGNFHLYKRDSSFLELRALAGIRYYIGRGNFLRGFYRFESSNILSGAANNPLFNQGETVRTNFYGLGIIRRQVDYIPNPTRGLNLDADFSVGLRKAFPTDSTGTRESTSTTFKLNLNLEYFIPLGKRHTIRLANLSQFYSADTIYSNEQIRFGGLTSQRGFDEEALFATSMTRFTLEYRFLLDKNSHLFAFFDQSIYENNSGNYYRDAPYGFGVGMSFGTRVGTFSISYALGSQMGNPIQFRDGKIHFGYIAFF